MDQSEFVKYVNTYIEHYSKDCRSASFDMCYGYFQTHKGKELKADIEKACLVLWSYLASYGMLRGSNKVVLDKNPFYLEELIGYIADNDLSDIDVSDYDDGNKLKRIISAYEDISNKLGFGYQDEMGIDQAFVPSIAFITKVMLGVYSCVPAFDTFFCEFLKNDVSARCVFCEATLRSVKQFFVGNGINPIDQLVTYAYDNTKNKSFKFNFARQVDMYGFEKGKENVEIDAKMKWEINDNNDFIRRARYVSKIIGVDAIDLDGYFKMLNLYLYKRGKFVKTSTHKTVARDINSELINKVNCFNSTVKRIFASMSKYLVDNSIDYSKLINQYDCK
jgi:hypothetical protein